MTKKLYRIREGKLIAGVCGGIAQYFEVDPKIVRLLFGVFCAAYGSGILVYIIFAIFIPKEPNSLITDRDT
ncbi:MAG: PspC domain-containing protein [Clostridium sp.]|nr:PspC domain-containing protein [Clostridium sp.]